MKKLIDDPQYAAATNNLNDLKHEVTRIEKRVSDAGREPVEDFDAVESLVKGIDLLDARNVRLQGSSSIQSPSTPPLAPEERKELDLRLQTLHKAIALQNNVLTRIKYRLSQEACRAVYPEYRAAVAKIADAARKLQAAAHDEREVVRGLESAGFAFVEPLRAMSVPQDMATAYTPDDPLTDYSWAARFLREAAEHGFIK